MTKAEKEEIRRMIENGSIYEDSRYKKWRNKVYKRDGYYCQFAGCKHPHRKLNAHHIHMKWYKPEWIFKLTNGITLCEYHHRYIHKRGSEKYIDKFEDIAKKNTESPKVKKKAKKLSKKAAKSRLKSNKKKGKKRIVRLVRKSRRLSKSQ